MVSSYLSSTKNPGLLCYALWAVFIYFTIFLASNICLTIDLSTYSLVVMCPLNHCGHYHMVIKQAVQPEARNKGRKIRISLGTTLV